MADFASVIDINPSTSINTSSFGLSCRDRKRVSRRMRHRAKKARKQAKHTPGPCNALAVCDGNCHGHHRHIHGCD
jgi:hypothetical protein